MGVFGRHSWDLDDRATWRDATGAAAPPAPPLEPGKEGLTPREIIARTPRRTTWDLEVAASPRRCWGWGWGWPLLLLLGWGLSAGRWGPRGCGDALGVPECPGECWNRGREL